ncbi:hypothetical protein T08_10550 [Trichinella sp. T8]|nr:hypothetical protein T08_10550 [Trichinella sp. T8]
MKAKLPRNSLLLTLPPFVDDMDLIRVGDRIQRLHLRYQYEHPVLLLKKHPLTVLEKSQCCKQMIDAQLKERQAETCAFDSVGMYFARPLHTKEGRIIVKTYVRLFTSMSTRGIHFRITSELAVISFIEAFHSLNRCNNRKNSLCSVSAPATESVQL